MPYSSAPKAKGCPAESKYLYVRIVGPIPENLTENPGEHMT